MQKKNKKKLRRVLMAAGRTATVFFVTLALLVAGALGAMWIMTRGPSPTMRGIFTLSVKETSAIGFLADIFLSENEVAEILARRDQCGVNEATDTSLITIAGGAVGGGEEPQPGEAVPAGITVEPVTGPSYSGYMMIVTDPARVFVGSLERYGGSAAGMTLAGMIEAHGAVAGINAGGFLDEGGGGTGGVPSGIVIVDGELVWGGLSSVSSVIGFDSGDILHVGRMSAREALDAGMQWAVSFGPALIVNGVPQNENRSFASGVNPRTAIGQRADGAVLLLVIDGRSVSSLGATFDDLIEVFTQYGAVNAGNLDGGSSTLMIYNGETMNNCASVYGPREIPTSFLVRAE